MSKFGYTAIDQSGKEQKGIIDAIDEKAAKNLLKNEGLIPINIGTPTALSKEITFDLGKRVSARDISVFCRQMTSMLNSAIPVAKALELLIEQTENKKLMNALENIKTIVKKGEPLSVAMGKETKAFPAILVNMVAAGEASGNLDSTFERMGNQFQKSSKLRGMIKKAMIYPVILMIVSILVVLLMSVIVVPRFVEIFNSMGAELPFITKLVVGMSNFIMQRWYVLFLILVAAIAAFKYSKQTDKGQVFWDNLKIHLPIVGKISIKGASANFARTMGSLIGAGLNLSDALEITGRSMDNILFKKALETAKNEVERGIPLSVTLKEMKCFPPLVYNMVSIGEETGNLDGMLENIAEYYEEEVELATASLSAAMEPLIIVVMGMIVGFIALAIYAPMISMYKGMNNM